MFDFKNNYLDEDYPWSGVLATTYFEIKGTYHTMLQDMPIQLVFRCDIILNTPFVDDW